MRTAMVLAPRASFVQIDCSPHGIDWEECPCPLCGSSEWAGLVESQDRSLESGGLWFMVVKCQECGLSFTNPRPSLACINQFYREDYGPHHAPPEGAQRVRWWQRLP